MGLVSGGRFTITLKRKEDPIHRPEAKQKTAIPPIDRFRHPSEGRWTKKRSVNDVPIRCEPAAELVSRFCTNAPAAGSTVIGILAGPIGGGTCHAY
jgi:hypothetical protein